jgi:hypothetical protein
MADPIVAPDVCRYTINGTIFGRPTANIMDMVVLPQLSTPRSDSILEVAKNLLDHWTDSTVSLMTPNSQLESVSWVDLDSLDGETGSIIEGNTHTWPEPGTASGESLPASVSVLVTKVAASSRGKRNGRLFLTGASETWTSGNFLTLTALGGYQSGMTDLLEQMTETSVLATTQYFPTVVHTKNVGTPTAPIIEYQGNSQIHAMTVNQRVASQRRRNRG